MPEYDPSDSLPAHTADLRAFADLGITHTTDAAATASIRNRLHRRGPIARIRRAIRLAPRPLVIAAVGLAVTGTATATVATISRSGTTEIDAKAKQKTPEANAIGAIIDDDAKAGMFVRWDGPVYGLKVTRGPITVRVATDRKQRICFETRPTAAKRIQGLGCTKLPLSATRMPMVRGTDGDLQWVSGLAPDSVQTLTVTDRSGRSKTIRATDNVFVAWQTGTKFKSVTWTTKDGKRRYQRLPN